MRTSPAVSCSGLSTTVSGIVQQFGTATMPWCSNARAAFTSGTTSGTSGSIAPGGRLVEAHRAALHGVGHELAGRRGADREEREIDVERLERLRRRLLDRAAVQLRAGRARRREQAHVVVAALGEDAAQHAAHRAGGADDGDAASLRHSLRSNSNASWSAATARSTSAAAMWHEILIGDVVTTSGWTPSPSSVANAVAATPGWLFIPAPTTETLPRSSRDDHGRRARRARRRPRDGRPAAPRRRSRGRSGGSCRR